MKRNVAILFVVAVGCGGGDLDGTDPVNDAGVGDGGMSPCAVGYAPTTPVVGQQITAGITVQQVTGVPTFTWTVSSGSGPVMITPAAADESQIQFVPPAAGPYEVAVTITNVTGCAHASATIQVDVPNAATEYFRLRAVPAASDGPPQEWNIPVKGGADSTWDVALLAGGSASGTVKHSVTQQPVAAYLKLMQHGMQTAFTELLTNNGSYQVQLLAVDHDVLVIPTSTALAPKLVSRSGTAVTQDLLVGPGTVVTGTVRGPSGSGLAGAKVQLSAGGVPSTLGTTAVDGTYSVRTDFPSGDVTVKITPPSTSGLPRLEATSAFSLVGPLDATYSASLATCDLGGTPVRRGGVARANAQVVVVGSLAGVAGTINGVNAASTVRVAATASGAGLLPSTLVPRGALSAVVQLSSTDHALSTVDTSACSVAQIDAPALTTVNGTTRRDQATAIDGIRVEAEPTGVLALAGVPPIHVVSNAGGAFTLPLAPGGRYNVRFTDPRQRVAPLTTNDVASAGVPSNALLPKAIAISGSVRLVSPSRVITGASVQILCATCSGLERTRPIAEAASDGAGEYRIAVPDPGTM